MTIARNIGATRPAFLVLTAAQHTRVALHEEKILRCGQSETQDQAPPRKLVFFYQ